MKTNFAVRPSGTAMFRAITLMLIFLAALIISVSMTGTANAASSPSLTVTYADNGATGGAVPVGATQYTAAATVKVSGNTGNLVKTGYTFGGWMAGSTIYQPANSLVITNDVTFTAVWVPVYTVTYDGNQNDSGTVPVDSDSYTGGVPVTVLGNTGNLSSSTKGFFLGWNTKPDGSGIKYVPGDTLHMGTANVTLYAQYNSVILTNYWTVTYNGNGNTEGYTPTDPTHYPTVPVVVIGSNTGDLTISGNIGGLVKTGQNFGGWNTKPDGTGTTYQPGDSFNLMQNLTLYALWLPGYTVTYSYNSSTISAAPPNDPYQYSPGVSTKVLANAATLNYEGGYYYTFGGWNTKADGTGTTYQPDDFFTVSSNVILYALWKDKRQLSPQTIFYVHYSGNGNTGGSVPADPGHPQYGPVTTPGNTGNLVRNGYVFGGWRYGSTNIYQPGNTWQIPPYDITLYAVWIPTCTLSYDGNGADGGTVPAGPTQFLQGTLTEVSGNTGNFNKELENFIGWNTKADGTGTSYQAGDQITLTGNVILYAQYLPTGETPPLPVVTVRDDVINYLSNGAVDGTVPVDAQKYAPGDIVTLPGNPGNLSEGNLGSFAGWSLTPQGSPVSYFIYPSGTSSVNVYAVWTGFSDIGSNRLGDFQYDANVADGGSCPGSSTPDPGDSISVPGNTGNLYKKDYHFGGWNTKPDGSGTTFQPGESFRYGDYATVEGTGSDDEYFLTLYAIWAQGPVPALVTYQVTPVNGGTLGGTVPPGLTVSYDVGDSVTVVSGAPTCTGSYFAGWNTKADGTGTTYHAGDTFLLASANPVTLYALFVSYPPHYVFYDGNGSTGGTPPVDPATQASGNPTGTIITVASSGNMTGPANTFFAGWNTKPDGSGTIYQPGESLTLGSADETLYAVWKICPGSYGVTYNGNGSTGGSAPVDQKGYAAGNTVTLPGNTGNMVMTGSLFAGWTWNNQIYQPGDTFTMPSGNVTIAADWASTALAQSAYRVTYDGNGNTGGSVPVDSASYQAGTAVQVLGNSGNLVKNGYVFSGWNDRKTTYQSGDALTMNMYDTTLYAVWMPSYTVTYDGNGNTGGSAPLDANSYLPNSPVKVVGNTSNLVKANSLFDGWWLNSSLYQPGSTFTMGTAGAKLSAVWVPSPTFTVDVATLSGGSITSDSASASPGTTINLTVTPDDGMQLKAETLKYNYGTEDYQINGTSFTMPAANVTVSAQFEPVPATNYSVSIGTLTGGSISANPTSATSGSSISLTITPNTGMQLKDGSLKYNDGTTDYPITGTSFTMPAANVTVSAEFEAIPPTNYSVSIGTLTGGSISANPTSATSGSSISLTITPNTGMQLKDGSLKYNDGTTDHSINGTSFTMPAANVTVSAQFEPVPANSYTVNIGTLSGGSITANPTTATSGTAISLTITPNTGMQLKDGSLKYNDGTTDYPITGTSFTMPAANVTVSAEFEAIPATTYTVTFDSQGGSVVSSIGGVTAGSVIGAPAQPTRQGYTFGGWYTDSACTQAWDFNTATVTSNVTLYAKWTAASSTSVPVTSITVTGASNATTVQNGSTLQMSAAVSPPNASNSSVTWLVIPGSGSATIDSSGLLTGTEAGTVTVQATANDGSGVSGTLQVTVTPMPAVPTAPILQSAVTDSSGTQIILTFDQAMASPGNNSAGNFNVSASRSGTPLTESVTQTALGSDDTQLILSLSQPLLAGDTISVSYTPGNLTSANGGSLAGFTDQTVTNQAPQPLTDTAVTVSSGQTNLAITSETISSAGSNPISITVPDSVSNASLNVNNLLQASSTETVSTTTMPALDITAAVNLNTTSSTPVNVQVQIPQGTTISAPAGWNGTIQVPTVQAANSVTVPTSGGNTATVDSVIEVGYGNVPLTFSHAVRILIPGQAGKHAGYVRNGTFTPITTVLSADNQSTADSTLGSGQDGYIDVGSDLVIWTKHFTQFVTYTETPVNTGGGGGGSYTSPSTPTQTTVTGSVINGSNETQVSSITATVTTDSNGNSTVSMPATDVVAMKGPDGTDGSMFSDLSKLTLISTGGSPITVAADGTLSIGNLAKGTDNTYEIVYDLGNGQKIAVGTMEVKIDSSGKVTLTATLIDPYGMITDATTGKALAGVNVTLYYADTARNKTAGKTPDTVVALPGIIGFKPNNNQDPQTSDVNGAYGFMVFPNTDYYIIASKDGYDQFTSPTISVDQEIVHWDFKMSPTTSGVTRLAGQSRVDTALAIAKAEYSGKVANVVLATADNYPDALAGSVLAYKLNAPILLVGSSEADQAKVLDYLKSNLAPSGTVYILGGTAVVSADMEDKVKADGFSQITRLGGTDRYETSVEIADQLKVESGTPIVLAYGENYPDALSISSIAAEMQYPILLVQKDGLSDEVKNEIASIKPSKVYIIGGEGVISTAVQSQVEQITSLDKTNIVRIAGEDRYATSLAVAQYFNLSGQSICIATGNNFPDALAGSVYAANHNTSIILADGSLSDQVVNYLKDKKLTGATIFGGEAVVSKGIEQQLGQLIGN